MEKYSYGGGQGASGRLNTLDIYDVASNSWSTGASGGTPCFGASSIPYNGKLYIWGGYDAGGNELNSLYIYDIILNTWVAGTSGGTARDGHAAFLYNGKIYYWAGDTTGPGYTNTLDIYDITTDTYSAGTAGGTGRYRFGSIFHNGKMYAWAGRNGSGTTLNTLDIYDTGIHPAFETLPGDTRPINIDEGQVITTPSYTLEVKPEGGNGVTQVEFKVDGNLICTDTTADADGVYSCLWDTTTYHSDIEIIAYFVSNDPITLTRSVTVRIPSDTNTATELPATGMDR